MKRRILKLCVFLLLGAIINVAVAWGCVLALPPWFDSGYERHIGEDENIALLRRSFSDAPTELLRMSSGVAQSRFGWTSWSILASNDLEGTFAFFVIVEGSTAGWPMYSVRGGSVYDGRKPSVAYVGAIRVPDWARVQPAMSQVDFVPFQPRCPGFAIDTIFYAAIAWMLFAAPLALRRRWRIKRGLCPACAYPVGDSAVCTECGKAVKR